MNKVIIVGGDHHNGLNLARIFGINNIPVEAVVITPYTKCWIGKSKYILKSYCVTKEKDAFDYIYTTYKNEQEKPFIIPYSDGAALELDLRLDEFKTWAYVPSIKNIQSEIAKLMDKKAQYDFAKKNNISMAESIKLNLMDKLSFDKEYDKYIIKPLVSAFGNKRDIRICDSKENLIDSLNDFKSKGYETVLIQQYLNIDYEIVIVGAVYKDLEPIFTAHKVIRRWPQKTGSNSFSIQCVDKNVLEQCAQILKIIQSQGYCGLIDVEVFVVNGKVYLNEINWRNSGGDFRALHNKFYYAFWWYMEILGKREMIPKEWFPAGNEYSMVEYADIKNCLKGEISIITWLKDFRKTHNFAVLFKGDMTPIYYKIVYKCFSPFLKRID